MLSALRKKIGTRLLLWEKRLQEQNAAGIERGKYSVLIFFHGYALAHTIRPLVVGRALAERGYRVAFAGRGPHAGRIEAEGFPLYDIETMPQDRMDDYVSRGDYAYYDAAWTDRCVGAERALIEQLRPDLLIHDMRPTASLTARLEGIDEIRITQAYNHPAFESPFEIPEGWIGEVGPFEEYLLQRATQVKPRRQLNALADVPEFHPAKRPISGYYYVGPLLDRPAAPARVPLLDEGWDTTLPLVYLTCGSSGQKPDYLEALIEAAATEPLRLFITTAGRAKLADLPANVRAVDYMPGEWVLERAQAMVGIVGVGAIYQALSRGVPVVAAAEHLDQEYHLAALERVGMGKRLQRREWTAPRIMAGVKEAIAQAGAREGEDQNLTELVRRWQGGARFADLVDRHFAAGAAEYRFDETYAVEEDAFLRSLEASTPNELDREALVALLQRGRKEGMPHKRRAGRLYYDQLDSWNWLYEREPRFFAADYWALEEKREAVFTRQGKAVASTRQWQDYRVTCSVEIAPQALAAGQQAKLFLPYPIERPGHQEQIRLEACAPGDLMAHFTPAMGSFYGYAFEGDPKAGHAFSYTCRLRVGTGGSMAPAPDAQERERCLQVNPRLARLAEVAAFFERCGIEENHTDETKARVLYEALARGTRFRKTKDAAQGLEYSLLAVISGKVGHCVTLSRAFIALCRMQGVPAREACGALFGYPVRPGVYRATSYCEPLFGHTWAEIYIEDKGWLPVEFHGVVIGENARTPHNAPAPELARTIAANDGPYRDYYFGGLDHTRMHLSPAVRRQPLCLTRDPESGEWEAAQDLPYALKLEAEAL